MNNKEVLDKITKVQLWDKNYKNKIEEILYEFIVNNQNENKEKLMHYIMKTTKETLNPKIVDQIINKHKGILYD
ncbi:MAG: hypothetical protein ACOC2W_01300 [bacterium]